MKIKWAKFRRDRMQDIRSFFYQRDCLEVEVPLMGRAVGSDPWLDYYHTEHRAGEKLYFHTSPEFFLKRLLAQGYPDIYYLGPTFRKGEHGSRHQPQFTILEWYRRDQSLEDLLKELLDLIEKINPYFKRERLKKKSYAELFSPLAVNVFDDTLVDLQNKIREWEGKSPEFFDRLEALDYIYATRVEPELVSEEVLIVTDYLPEQAALAQIEVNSEGRQVAKRFELYLNGVEIANAYQELTDAVEQRRRFVDDLEKRHQLGKDIPPIDERFLEALQEGFPSCSGIAVGVDRLLMIISGQKDLKEVISFDFDEW